MQPARGALPILLLGAQLTSCSQMGIHPRPVLPRQATFLPSGYPHTVAPHYLRNTLWQAVHHTCGSVNGGALLQIRCCCLCAAS